MELSLLNPAQAEAVRATEGAVLVMAGAGSGKTRVLTMRAAFLMENGVPPYAILALTFTNKAAAEMRARIEKLSENVSDLWVGTFHSICARILRIDAQRLGYTSNYTIYDESDAVSLIKTLLAQRNIDPKLLTPKQVKYAISRAKNADIPPDGFADEYADNPDAEDIADIYADYEKRLAANNAMDFDDLLLKTLMLFEQHRDVLAKYAGRFRYIMVDEYQDTNLVQYELVRHLASVHGNIFAVGDDDQSIYGWRGADIRNILEFEKDFPNCRTIYLEQNYRSYQGILDVANDVIAGNPHRKPKRLFSDKTAGVPPCDYCAANEFAEAEFIASECASLKYDGMRYDDMAVLYRVNAQSRVIEDEFKRRGIPYRIYGGQGFYERKEIKDIIAYLNVIANPAAEMSLVRIINEPKRGIGETTVGKLRDYAAQNGIALFFALDRAGEFLNRHTSEAIGSFVSMMTGFIKKKDELPLDELVCAVCEETGYISALRNEHTPEADARIANVEELQNVVSEYLQNEPEGGLESFLERNSLLSDVDAIGDESGVVSLMTMHAAKGLEFEAVFIAGMENKLLPHIMAGQDIDEERRLCYVAMTRAKRRLYLCHAMSRRERSMGGFDSMPQERSLFIDAIAEGRLTRKGAGYDKRQARKQESLQRLGSYAEVRRTQSRPVLVEKDTSGFAVGQEVLHDKFGRGRITSINGQGKEKIAVVNFGANGERKMFLAFAPLKRL